MPVGRSQGQVYVPPVWMISCSPDTTRTSQLLQRVDLEHLLPPVEWPEALSFQLQCCQEFFFLSTSVFSTLLLLVSMRETISCALSKQTSLRFHSFTAPTHFYFFSLIQPVADLSPLLPLLPLLPFFLLSPGQSQNIRAARQKKSRLAQAVGRFEGGAGEFACGQSNGWCCLQAGKDQGRPQVDRPRVDRVQSDPACTLQRVFEEPQVLAKGSSRKEDSCHSSSSQHSHCC